MDESDYRIFKIVIFTRAVSNALKLAGNLSGIYKPVENSDDKRLFTTESAIGLAVTIFCSYCFIYEPNAMTDAFKQ